MINSLWRTNPSRCWIQHWVVFLEILLLRLNAIVVDDSLFSIPDTDQQLGQGDRYGRSVKVPQGKNRILLQKIGFSSPDSSRRP